LIFTSIFLYQELAPLLFATGQRPQIDRQLLLPLRLARQRGLVGHYWLNRKNRWVPEMGVAIVFCSLTMTGEGKLVFQITGKKGLWWFVR
jgi:hypothetical protein